jgi:(1->4)-alpha-D-glucan 1-alpha-D-glucosylmutase
VKTHSQVPTATYRLQLNGTFTFRDAASIIPYLHSLGISHCYVSPYLRARPGSLHGYDIIDHNALNPEIGTIEDYEHFVAELHRHGMGQILDIVPNHMGVMGSDNAWWLDVLENGEASDYAEFFDIDWTPIKDELQGKVLIPILGDQYGNELESGQLKLVFDEEHGEFSILYHQHRFPVDPAEYPRILGHDIEKLQKLGATNEDFLELQSVSTAFGHVPSRRELNSEQRAERNREKEVQKRRLAALCAKSPGIREFLRAAVEGFNGEPGNSRSFDLLHDLIKAQVYRLAQWRVAADDINYRRFFDINDLAALRMENDDVFDATHRLILELVAERKVDGLRIDHPDGLYDPAKYLRQLRDKLAARDEGEAQYPYIVVEKILTGKERLRPDWPVDGTTGYEFANAVNGLFVSQNSADKMQRIYRFFSGNSLDLADLVYQCKKLILKVSLASELNVLANLLSRIALSNRHTCDFTLNSLRSALSEMIASFPVYRTYVSGSEVSTEDRHYVEQAVRAGKRRSDAPDLSVFDFIRHVLLVEVNGVEPEWYKRAIVRFAMKFQQVTAAVMAKGLEDTAFYRYNCLVSLNEVGGNPGKFGISIEEFHRANEERLACWPHSMLATSSHDSKRSEDVRARIDVLSEIPSLWRRRVNRWRDWNRGKKANAEDSVFPSPDDEYLLYQTLVGAWPGDNCENSQWAGFTDRIDEYMLKAAREAKEHTRWANQDLEYESALSAFVRSILDRSAANPFLEDFSEFHRSINRMGAWNSLSQCLLKMTCPGVPDIYQGNELFEFALVDPDNRQPVDYDRRHNLLKELCAATASAEKIDFEKFAADPAESSLKLYVTWKTLQVRKKRAPLFDEGSYIPLRVMGSKAEHVVAFAREDRGKSAIVAVPRLCATLLGENAKTICDESVWEDTRIETPNWQSVCFHHAFTGECVPVETNKQERAVAAAKVFGQFPVGLLLADNQR